MNPTPHKSVEVRRSEGLPLPPSGCCRDQARPGVEYRHHVHSPGTRIRLPGGDHRLVFTAGAELADQQQYGYGVLY